MNRIIGVIEDKKDKLTALSDGIWDVPETAFTEFQSAKLLCDALKSEGFEVEEGVAGISTAFSGKFGSGKPVIGILGEFDALSGLSQVAGCAEKTALVKGANGHGCGHHLLGTAGIGAAIAIKDYLQSTGNEGTVIYFGCPGEEGGSGKAFMAREGVFDMLDCALSWHPSDATNAWSGSTLANVQVAYKFKGLAAHAAAVPHLGRSALDAVELMNVGVNYLREHVIPEARMHYAVTNTGGFSPNVVQAEAEVLYLIRAPKNAQVQDIYKRINKIAQGASLMTETDVEIDFIKACSNIIPNNVMEKVLDNTLREIPHPTYTAEEIDLAGKFRATSPAVGSTVNGFADKVSGAENKKAVLALSDKALIDEVMPYIPSEAALAGSSDVGDVSWVCPTAQINVACYAADTPGHSWQLVAQGKEGPAHKGMLYAAKVMAGAAIKLMENPDLIQQAKEEHKLRVGDGYVCPIPKGVQPRSIAPKK